MMAEKSSGVGRGHGIGQCLLAGEMMGEYHKYNKEGRLRDHNRGEMGD